MSMLLFDAVDWFCGAASIAEQHPVGWSALVVGQASNEQPQVGSCCTSTQVELALVSSASAHFPYGMDILSQASQW